MTERFPCPCCGHKTFDDGPGSYMICPVCYWEDDDSQLRWPDSDGGANRTSLIDSQRNYQRFAAMEEQFQDRVRIATPDEPVEPGWRPIDLSIDHFEADLEVDAPWPRDRTVMYWWRPTFWRRHKSSEHHQPDPV